MKKRLLSLAIAICIVAAMLPTFALSASALEVNGSISYYFCAHATNSDIPSKGAINTYAVNYNETTGRYWKYLGASTGNAKKSPVMTGRINGDTRNVNQFIALNIYVPEDGIYETEYYYYKMYNNGSIQGGKGDVYILPEGTEIPTSNNATIKSEDVTTKYNGINIASGVDYSAKDESAEKNPPEPVVSKGIDLKKGDNILLFVVTGHGDYVNTEDSNTNIDHHTYPTSLTLTLTEKKSAEDEELKAAFNPTPVDVPTQYAPSVSALKYVDGAESNVDAIAVSAKDEDGDGTYNVSTSTTDNSYKFLYWVKGKSTSKIIVSRAESFTYTPGNGDVNYLIAVYEKDGETEDKAEFYNANGQLIAAVKGTTVETPDLPSMAGYGEASKWVNANGEKFDGKVNVNISGTVMFIAEYAEPATTFTIDKTKCETDKTSYKYGDLVKCTATGTSEDGTFKCWKRDGVVVSRDKEYSFSAWKKHKVEAVYTKDEFTFNGAAQQIILEIFGDNVMAEFIGFTNVVEKGIILDTQEIAMTTDKTQFTVEFEDAASAKGYVIVKDGNSFKKYTDGDITLTQAAE